MPLVENGVVGEFPYAIQYNDRVGNLCGYIGVPQSHPWYGKDYDDVECEVHGGLTYGSESDDEYPCPLPVKVWWFGFDCGHAGDKPSPEFIDEMRTKGMSRYYDREYGMGERATYRDRDYVFAEIEGMAKQAAEAMQVAS